VALSHQGERPRGPAAIAMVPDRSIYMSSMAELRGGLSEGQREHAKQQRKQLQLDLEQQAIFLSHFFA